MDVPVNPTVEKSAKILLVDDKAQNLLSMESILEQDGYSFTRAYSGKEALKILLHQDDFALILMDVNMPVLNGYETASLIYKRQKLTHIPIIFITAFDYDEENIFKGYKSGAIDYIFKPINPELLKIKVKVFIELFKKNRQLVLQEEKLKEINDSLKQQIAEKKVVTEELRFKNIQLTNAQKLTHLGSWHWDILTNKIKGSEEIYEIFEIEPYIESFDVDKMLKNVHPGDLYRVRSALADSISKGESFDVFFKLHSAEGRTKFVNTKGRIIHNDRNEVIKIFGTSQDVTNFKLTEEQLKIFNLLEKVLNEIYIFNADDFTLTYANADALRNLGYNIEEIKQFSILDILPEFKKTSFKRKISPLIKGAKDKIFLFSNFKRKDESFYPVEIHLQLIEQGERKLFLAVVLDLTERKRSEQVLAASLKEKETLLKEIHHRVKNNLQIIYSLINLQSSSISDSKITEIFKESQNRIRSMALIHEKLYQHNDLANINFAEYIDDLVLALSDSYRVNTDKIKITVDAEKVLLSIDIAISMGLCITELVTNCFKYAFPDSRSGEVRITLKQENSHILLCISDDGVGLPDGFHIEGNESLGLKIVETLVEQHSGRLSVSNNGITEFSIEVPLDKDSIEDYRSLKEN
jgi:PAS domain S-box-containing protein